MPNLRNPGSVDIVASKASVARCRDYSRLVASIYQKRRTRKLTHYPNCGWCKRERPACRGCWILGSVEGGLESLRCKVARQNNSAVQSSALYLNGAERRGRSWLCATKTHARWKSRCSHHLYNSTKAGSLPPCLSRTQPRSLSESVPSILNCLPNSFGCSR